MSRTTARLAEFDRINRERSLTDDEQRAVILLAQRQRQHARKRERYVPMPRSKRDVAQAKVRNEQGRFV